ncbi:Zinc-type alcohol dehydrogenase-like protein [Elsinoe australis]|uniref:Zinc-type alcohol dehydrogenase-like protein n=1 Tax=Elsinoe australis TaxID=40998 RepID=A0A2P8A0R9_9PEZI|nr:Zinc-type alcohol dehydrogenase-like protein [Elsinoe australis]
MAPSNPSTMRAWQYTSTPGGLERNLSLNTSVPYPFTSPSPNELIIQVHATALNPADYKLAEVPLVPLIFPRKPASPSMDFSGVVHAAGATSGLSPGDRVAGRIPPTQYGALSEYVKVDRGAVARLPDAVGFVDGACLGTAGMTALQSLEGVREGDRVLVNGGSGGVGTYAVQIAKLLGARVTATCSSANVSLVRELGAGEVVDYKGRDVGEVARMGEWDLVVDLVGKPFGLHKACDGGMKRGGRFVQVGAGVDFWSLVDVMRSALLPGVLGGAKTKWKFLMVGNKREDVERLVEWTAQGKLKTVVDTVFAYEDAPKAFEKLKTGRARGKIVVSNSDR